MRSVWVLCLLMLGAYASSETSSEVILLDLEPQAAAHEQPLAEHSNSTSAGYDPGLKDSIISAGSFKLTSGVPAAELGEAPVSQTEIAAALKAGGSGKSAAGMPSERRVGQILVSLRASVDGLCDQAEQAPVRVDDLEKLKVKAHFAKQKESIDAAVVAQDLDAQGRSDLEARLKETYASLQVESETANAEQKNLENKCRSSKEDLLEITAVADRIRVSRMSEVKLPEAAYRVNKLELERMPVCKKLLGVKEFQQWLASSHLKDLEMQRKETSCWANKITVAEYKEAVLKDVLGTAKDGSRMAHMGLRCILDPLVERLFKAVAGTQVQGSEDDVTDFVKSIELRNHTLPEISMLQEDSLTVTVNSTNTNIDKLRAPAVKYECLNEEYRKQTGAFATGKAAIEENAQIELRRVENMAAGGAGSTDLGEIQSNEERCSSFLSAFFKKADGSATANPSVIADLQAQLTATPQSGLPEDSKEAEHKLKTATDLKGKLKQFLQQLKQVVSTQSAEHVTGIETKLQEMSSRVSEAKVKMSNSQSEVDAIKARRGTNKKLESGGCAGTACYLGTEFKTEAIAPFRNQESEDYQTMNWVCRRNADSEDHTKNSFMCNSEDELKGSVVCSGKEMSIGQEWLPFLRQTSCTNAGCQDVKQCSSSDIQVSTNSAVKLLRLNCMAL